MLIIIAALLLLVPITAILLTVYESHKIEKAAQGEALADFRKLTRPHHQKDTTK